MAQKVFPLPTVGFYCTSHAGLMIELCFFSLDQWELKIHLLWGKCFNITHWSEASRPMRDSNTSKSFLIPRQELIKPCLMTYCPWQLLVSLLVSGNWWLVVLPWGVISGWSSGLLTNNKRRVVKKTCVVLRIRSSLSPAETIGLPPLQFQFTLNLLNCRIQCLHPRHYAVSLRGTFTDAIFVWTPPLVQNA